MLKKIWLCLLVFFNTAAIGAGDEGARAGDGALERAALSPLHMANIETGLDMTNIGLGSEGFAPSVQVAALSYRSYSIALSIRGLGSVSSSPSGLKCSSSCTAKFRSGTMVTLTPVAAVGFRFGGWSGNCASSRTCTVTMDQERTVSATFVSSSPVSYALSVSKTGAGSVNSSPSGIGCGTTCSSYFNSGAVVTLTPVAEYGYSFSGWSGACSGTGSCSVTMSQARSVTANFAVGGPSTFTLTVNRSGQGAVNSSPTSIGCGTTCSANFNSGTVVTLTAEPYTGYSFSGWGGACSGTGTCTTVMTQSRSVSATFVYGTPSTFTLSVSKSGSGSVNSSPGGISCGSSCSASFSSGTVVVLTPVPASGYSFSAWGGACSGAGTCSVTMSQARSVSASFVPSGGTGDTIAPSVISTNPASAATAVAVTSPISVTFSEAIDCNSLTTSSFTVTGTMGVVSCSGSSAVFTPSEALASDTVYSVQLSTDIKDLAGNALSGAQSWSFTTASESSNGDKFTFLAYGDSRAGGTCLGNQVHMGLVQRMVNEPAQFVFHLGDMVTGSAPVTNWVQRGDCPLDASRGSFKEIIAPLQNKAPAQGVPTFFFPVVGNHDDSWLDNWYPDKFGDGFCSVFNPQLLVQNHTQHFEYFKDTTNRVTHYSDAEFFTQACSTNIANRLVYPGYIYYSFKFKNSVFIVLRVNTDYYNLMTCGNCRGDLNNYDDYYYKHQLDWMRYVLAQANSDSAVDNVFVFMHAPLVTTGDSHGPNASWPILLKEFSTYSNKMKIVFSGHNHFYERSYPVFTSDAYPNGVRDDVNGTVYTITGGGGSPLDGFNRVQPLIAKKSATYHYMRIDVNGKAVSAKAIGLDGAEIDSFSK